METDSDSSLELSHALWFKPERFLEPNFNVEAYVADLKRYVPMETLRGELQSHVSVLKSKLVEVINDDYNDFVSLSTKLVSVDGAVLRMQKPLLELKERLEGVRGAVAGQADELEQGLQRRQGVAAARELLELLQDTAHIMSKVEKLLGEVHPLSSLSVDTNAATGGTPAAAAAPATAANGQEGVGAAEVPAEALEGQCRLLDRVCSEVSRLNFYAAKGQDLAFMQKMQPRIQSASSRLQSELSSAMRAALAGGHATALGICLHGYSALGVPLAAEQVVREALVAPTVREAVAAHKASQPLGGAGAGASLAQLLPDLVAQLQARLGGVLSQAVAASASAQAFDFLGGAVLPEVVAALEEQLPGVFSPGVPSLFHANYTATMQLLDTLEGNCQSLAQVQQFRQSSAYQALLKKWNLPVYYSLRFQDIAGMVESQLASPSLESGKAQGEAAAAAAAGPGEPALALLPSLAVWRGLQLCVEADVFLPQLADRFVRLAMQLLARYATWIQQGMAQRSQALEAAAAAAQQAPVAGAPQGQRQGAEQAAKPEPTWAEAATPDQLALLLHDAGALAEGVMEAFVPALSRLMQDMTTEAGEAVVMAFQESAGQLSSAGGALLGALADTLTDQCVVVLRQLRGIVATFRMTKRAQPDRPSHYVSAILNPLTAFLQGEAARRLGEQARAQLTQAVVAGIAQRYQQLADDTLSTVRKTESSLKRLKTRQRLGAEGEAGGAPDTDKMIAMQLLLDVQEFGRLAGAAGVDLSEVEAHQQLWATVSAPADETAPS